MGRRRRRATPAARPHAASAPARSGTRGDDLASLPEPDATQIAVEVAQRLWRPADAPFRWIGDHVPCWLAAAEEASGRRLLPLARRLYADFDVGSRTLVHGDFHHHNVLASGDTHVAIDPKPMLGEPEFDVASFLWNPLSYRMRPDVTERRIAAFVAAGLDERRIRMWAIIRGAYLAPEEAVEVLRGLHT